VPALRLSVSVAGGAYVTSAVIVNTPSWSQELRSTCGTGRHGAAAEIHSLLLPLIACWIGLWPAWRSNLTRSLARGAAMVSTGIWFFLWLFMAGALPY
jgi:hypothetical protein